MFYENERIVRKNTKYFMSKALDIVSTLESIASTEKDPLNLLEILIKETPNNEALIYARNILLAKKAKNDT